jgi:hypothetical protein
MDSMWLRILTAWLGLLMFLSGARLGVAQISKGNQILLTRGLQVEGLVVTYDTFHLSTYSNANYTAVLWLWDSPRSYNNMAPLGPAPGFPWARWVYDESDMPPLGQEAPYLSQLVNLQLADEWNLNDDATRTRAVNWFTSVRSNWPNTILSANNWGGQVSDGNLLDFITRAQPDMICFDTYPWQSVWDVNAPNHTGPPIGGPPTQWYGHLRTYRDIARAFNIPFGSYVQTFHAVQDYNTTVYRDPSPSELRLNHSGALAFNAKMLIDFLYNNGSSSLFNPPGGDSNPNALYYEKADCARRARNLGRALVRLKPIDEATPQWTTSILFVRGRDENGNLNPIPLNFYAGPSGTNPNTDWVADRNDPYLRGWVVTNTGTKNNGQPGDVLIAWFKALDESFDGPAYTNEIYFMVVNGLTATNGTAADCSQEIKLNFLNTFSALDLLDPVSGQLTNMPLPLVSTRRQLVLNLNGGDAVLFKIADGAPFVGFPFPTNAPVILEQPASRTNVVGSDATFTVTAAGAGTLSYQWRFAGTNIGGATGSSYTRFNVQTNDAGDYRVVVTNAYGSVTSAVATLTVLPAMPILYEPFNYPNVGGPVSSNTPANWAYGGTGANDLNVAGGSLAYPGLAASVGNSVTNGGAGLGVRRLFGTLVNSGALYFSALFRINDLGYGSWNGAASQVGAFADTNATSNFRLAVMVKSNSPGGYVIGVQKGGTGVTPTFDTTEFRANQTVFLVGRYDFGPSPNTVSLWINPDPATFGAGSPPAGFISASTGTDGFVIDRFNLRQNTATSVPAAMQWDELRVGYTWADVTPPSGSTTVLLTDVTRLGDGTFRFAYSMSGLGGTVYASTNLLDWTALGAPTPAAPGLYEFTDADATNYPQRFYQLRFP